MKNHRSFATWCGLALLPLTLMVGSLGAGDRHRTSKPSVCTNGNPESFANASNTCGSSSTPCVVDIKRTTHAATATPSIPNAKGNAPFSVKVGTTVTWQSVTKNTGFLVDFGSASPFDAPGAILGGSDRSVSLVAKRKGCFKFSVGACYAGADYGMCEEAASEIVVTGGAN